MAGTPRANRHLSGVSPRLSAEFAISRQTHGKLKIRFGSIDTGNTGSGGAETASGFLFPDSAISARLSGRTMFPEETPERAGILVDSPWKATSFRSPARSAS
jgi:hypothetical protein